MTDGAYLHSGAGTIVKMENIGDGCTRQAPRINVGGSLAQQSASTLGCLRRREECDGAPSPLMYFDCGFEMLGSRMWFS